MAQIYARIVATGSALPERVVTNADLEKIVDTSDEWIRSRTGIRQRHIAADGQTTGDLAFEAAVNALGAAGVKASELDLIVLGTTTPDIIFPSTACLIQHRLGANGCAAFDVNAACSGFVYALGIANNFIRAGQAKKVLVIGAETLTRMVNWAERETCVLFGDGAGAVVLEASSEPGIHATCLHADGGYKELLYNPVGVSVGFNDEANHGVNIRMSGREVFKVAVKTLDSLVGETLQAAGMDESQIDWLIPHQANLRIIEATAKRLNMSMDRVIVTVDKHANTSAGSVPLALDYAVRSGKVQRGQNLLLEAFGGGFTWASALLRY
jgi:3-oxoacyl-[acyl-carrier-protein] synthase-3